MSRGHRGHTTYAQPWGAALLGSEKPTDQPWVALVPLTAARWRTGLLHGKAEYAN